MSDLDRITAETVDSKVETIRSELNTALDSYAEWTRKSLEQGNVVDPHTETELLGAIYYLGSLLNGLTVIFALEAKQQVGHLRSAGVADSAIKAATSACQVRAMRFIENLVQRVNSKISQVLGLPINVPIPKPPEGNGGSLN